MQTYNTYLGGYKSKRFIRDTKLAFNKAKINYEQSSYNMQNYNKHGYLTTSK